MEKDTSVFHHENKYYIKSFHLMRSVKQTTIVKNETLGNKYSYNQLFCGLPSIYT